MNKVTKTGGGIFAAAVTLVAAWEGYYGYVYKDVVGVPTYCYGETDNIASARGKTFTKAECLALLKKSLVKYDEGFMKCVNRPIPDSVHIVGISLSYNIGWAGACRSQFVKKINEGDFKGACNALMGYVHAKGRVIRGLVNRRAAERKQCLEGL